MCSVFRKWVFVVILGMVGLAADLSGAHVQRVWGATYSGEAGGGDSGKAIALDAHGNVYVTGQIEKWSERPNDDNENWLTIKYDAEGNEVWTAEYGSDARKTEEWPTAIAVNRYGEVFVAGGAFREGRDRLTTLMYSPEGDVLWTSEFADLVPSTFLKTDAEGNLYGIGPPGLIKYARDGRLLWSTIYPGHAEDMIMDDAGNVYVTGVAEVLVSNGVERAMATFKFSANGETNWSAFFNDPEGGYEYGFRVKLDFFGDVFVTGVLSEGTNTDLVTIKYDASGNQLWAMRYAPPGGTFEFGADVLPDSLGGAYVVGTSHKAVAGYVSDFLLIRYDSEGHEMWTRQYSGRPNSSNRAIKGALDALGNVYVIGYADITNSHPAYDVVKYDGTGRRLWAERIDGPQFFDSTPPPLLLTPDALYMTGLIFTNNAYDFLSVKFALTNAAPVADATATRTRIILLNNRDAVIELNGTRSFDADGDSLSFAWLWKGRTIGSDARVTKRVGVGTHIFTLVVSDGTASDSDTVTVEAVTAEQAVRALAGIVRSAPLSPGHERQLLRNLELARISFDRGYFQAGIVSLSGFQTYTRRHSRAIGPALAQQLISEAEAIISALQR
jgi:hypothetical protein